MPISLEEGNVYVNRMRKVIQSFPEVETVVSQHGRPDDGTDAAGLFNAEFFAPLKPVDQWPAGVDKDALQIQAQANTIRISGKKAVDYADGASVHRRERVSGEFDRTLSLPVELDPDAIKAEYRDGLLALYLPRAESDKPRNIKIK